MSQREKILEVLNQLLKPSLPPVSSTMTVKTKEPLVSCEQEINITCKPLLLPTMVARKRKNDKKPEEASRKDSPETTPTPDKTTKNEPEDTAADGHRGASFPWRNILVALLSLILGLCTPPLLNAPVVMVVDPPSSSSTGRSLLHDAQPAGAALVEEDPCNEQKLLEFWHNTTVPGFHIICLKKSQASDDSLHIRATFYKYGMRIKEKKVDLPFFLDWSILREAFVENLGLRSMKQDNGGQPWAVFSNEGKRLVSEDSEETVKGQYPVTLIGDYGMLLLFEGGQFIWPGVRIGFERKVDLYSIMPEGSPDMESRKQTVTLETLSLVPLVVSVEGFLSDAECKHVQEIAAPSMKYSDVVLMDKDAGRPASDFRTSQTTFLEATDSALVDIDYRTASLVRIPRTHQEHTQVRKEMHPPESSSSSSNHLYLTLLLVP
jgi:hypothetical protein